MQTDDRWPHDSIEKCPIDVEVGNGGGCGDSGGRSSRGYRDIVRRNRIDKIHVERVVMIHILETGNRAGTGSRTGSGVDRRCSSANREKEPIAGWAGRKGGGPGSSIRQSRIAIPRLNTGYVRCCGARRVLLRKIAGLALRLGGKSPRNHHANAEKRSKRYTWSHRILLHLLGLAT